MLSIHLSSNPLEIFHKDWKRSLLNEGYIRTLIHVLSSVLRDYESTKH